jgi:hypothetical protein
MSLKFINYGRAFALTVLTFVCSENLLAGISNVSATSDASNAYYQMSYTETPTFFRIYLDSDRSAATGYPISGIGANFMIENNYLYKYSGSNGSWAWGAGKFIGMTKTTSLVKWTVARADIGSPSALTLVANVNSPSYTSAVIAQNLATVVSPPSTTTTTLPPTTGWTRCAVENGTCSFSGTREVRYGANGVFAYRTATGSIACNNATFGDPVYGAVKACDYSNALVSVTTTTLPAQLPTTTTTMPAPTPTTTTLPAPTPTTTTLPAPTPTTTTMPAPTATGPTYYLSPSGNDANSGSASAPWRTIQKAANTVVAGDTVILMNGTYEEPSISFTRSGTAAKPIVFKAQNKWMAILASMSGCNPGFSINASHIKVKDIRFSVSSRNATCGIYTSANAHIRAWNTNVATPANPSTGSEGFGADGIKVDLGQRSEGVKSNQDYTIIENSVFDQSIEIFSVKDSIIRNNVVNQQDQAGVSILAKGGVRNAQIYGNIVYNKVANGRGIIIGGFSCDLCFFDTSAKIEAYNTVAYNNVVINQSSGGMTGLDFEGAKDSAFFNNIVINGSISMTVGGHNAGFQYPTTNPTFKNNIVVCNGGPLTSGYFGWAYSGTLSVDYNQFSNCSSGVAQTHNVSGTVSFVNAASDWHLQPGSAGINTGTPISFIGYGGVMLDLSRDKNGVVRSTPWDLGIYNVTP